MAEIKITSRLETKTVSEKFKTTYGVSLRYYFLTRNATSSWRIAELSDNKGGELLCNDNMTISQFNKGIAEQFGGRILVFDKSNQYLIDDDITFANAKSWKPKANKEFSIHHYYPADYVIRLCKDAFNINLKIYTYEDITYPVVSEENWFSPIGYYTANYKSIFTKDRTGASIKCSGSMTVEDFEQKMKESFGILVKVANAKDQIIAKKKTTLEQAANSVDVVKDSLDNTISPYWSLEMINKLSPDAKIKFKFYGTSGRLIDLCRQTPKPEAILKYDKSMTVGELCNKFKDIFNAIVAVTDDEGNYIPYDIKLSDTPKWKYDKTKGFYIFPNMPISWLDSMFKNNLLQINNKDNNSFIHESKNTIVLCTDDMTIDEIKKDIKSKYGNDLEISSIFGNNIPTNLPLNKICDYVKEQGFDISSYHTIGEVKAKLKSLYNLNIHFINRSGYETGSSYDNYKLNYNYIFGEVPQNAYKECKGSDTIAEFTKAMKDNFGINVCFTDNDGVAVCSDMKFANIDKIDNKKTFAISSYITIGNVKSFFKKSFNLNIHFINRSGYETGSSYDNYQLNYNYIFGEVPQNAYMDCKGSDTIAEFTRAMKDNFGINVCFTDNDGIAVCSDIQFANIDKIDNKKTFAISSYITIGNVKSFFKKSFNLNIHFINRSGYETGSSYDNYQLNYNYIFGDVPQNAYMDCKGSDTIAEFTKAMKDNFGIIVNIEGNQERALNINCPKETSNINSKPKPQPAPAPKQEPKETEPKKETPKPQPTPAPKAEPKAEPKKETPKPQPAKKVEIKENTVNGKTTYSFNGEDGLSKSKLCLSIIRYYIEQNLDITVSQLREMFNIKNNNMVETIDGALKICDSSGKAGGNYSMKDADQIATKEGKVVVWNYWPERYFNPFMEIVETHVFASSDKKETPKPQPAPAPKAEPKKEAPKPEVRRPSADDMNVLDKLIDAALEDFVLTDEERSVLLKKSKEIGLGEDEFKIYLNGKIQERMKDKPAEKVEEKKKGFFARLFGR